jgi:hypothetical protein
MLSLTTCGWMRNADLINLKYSEAMIMNDRDGEVKRGGWEIYEIMIVL